AVAAPDLSKHISINGAAPCVPGGLSQVVRLVIRILPNPYAQATRGRTGEALSAASFIGQCGKGRIVARPGRELLAGDLAPLRRIDLRKHRVPLRPEVHTGDLEARGHVDCLRIYACAATHDNGRGA